MIFDSALISSSLLTFLLVIAAEMGDKSQIVCMALAAKYRAKLVFIGAITAFMVLNLLAVLLGASLGTYIPMSVVSAMAAIMFFIFGIQALLSSTKFEQEEQLTVSRSVIISAFTIILLAEMGDKTQLTVATLSASEPAFMVWMSASLALSATTGFGVFMGKKWLAKLNIQTIHRVSGMLFILFAIFATIKFFYSLG